MPYGIMGWILLSVRLEKVLGHWTFGILWDVLGSTMDLSNFRPPVSAIEAYNRYCQI